jgi:leader peptidase (prepilin peptidase) / N-methyltransferase
VRRRPGRTVSASIFLAAILGAALGVAADRLAARWPVHEDGRVRPLDWRTLTVSLGSAASFALLAWRWSEPADLLVLGIYTAALMLLLATDLDQRLLPDLITLPLIVYGAAVTLLGLNPVLADKAQVLLAEGDLSAVLAAVLAPGLLAVTDRIFHGALGMGDLKLAVSLGLMFGLTQLFAGFLAATVAFAAIVLLLVVTRRVTLRTAIPFGPALIGAGVLASVLGT